MLSCGRPDTLWRCLDSLVPIREAVPSELIIVDTGCPVDIRERMAEYTDIIIPFTWCDDFSAARNAGLDAACGEWFMYIDDDEYFSDVRDIVTFFTSGRYRDYHNACYIQRNHHDAAGRTWRDAWAGRMISMEPRPVFKGRIHEYLSSPAGDGGGILLHSVAEHYGYVYETPEARQAHFLRNSTILLHMLAEDPGDGRSRMQLIYEYLGMEDATSALSQCREGLAAIEARSENDSVTAGFFRVTGPVWALSLLMVLGGLAALIFGGRRGRISRPGSVSTAPRSHTAWRTPPWRANTARAISLYMMTSAMMRLSYTSWAAEPWGTASLWMTVTVSMSCASRLTWISSPKRVIPRSSLS